MKEALDCQTNSPCQHLKKCIENSMENIDTDIRVLRVNLAFSLPVTIVHFLYLLFP